MKQEEFPAWLRAYLRERNISQRELAHQLDRSETWVSMVVNGKRFPGKEVIKHLGLRKETHYVQASEG